MLIENQHYRTVWYDDTTRQVAMINQNKLPFVFELVYFKTYQETAEAIRDMTVRGAGAIGATAGFAMAQAFDTTGDLVKIQEARAYIEATRPTAVNLFYATEKVFNAGKEHRNSAMVAAQQIADEDAEGCRLIGEYGNTLIKPSGRILTHCNAGWLAFVDYGSALSPVYAAHNAGKQPFVYVDETRPRGQGARLTAYELEQNKVDHRIIADNAAAYYMAKGAIDMVITGADRITANGDVANKIGTLEKAILAKEFGIPFYVAAPFSTFDFNTPSGDMIVIEERSDEELLYHEGPDEHNIIRKIRMAAPGSAGLNPAFDVTPHRYITGFITNRGIIRPDELKGYQ
ncbi:S-methyl-5-thioribose-1-phosphate isomerase [Carboxylicivirga sediminis]|uniref:Methylthioribose-1-phosphate isomerase n=1 Tax=Carboxylicivirga sediminis TaxID=2006564 RepID=A0A941F3N2_9BACT|nr:S-methyl-5-thioribose-1-phosphate isomerase [Carboxylicivirga sediminis]MBR8535764.1 S-methyl-5-thioribose-1-phosphate isomerase [Carboxylicivirga sediminis]